MSFLPYTDAYYLISEDEINGTAFKDLTEKDLKEMDFKRGPRMNIMKIIAELKVRALHGCILLNFVTMYHKIMFSRELQEIKE